MNKVFLFFAFLLVGAANACGQQTIVTATVVDPRGFPYQGGSGTFTVQCTGNSQPYVNGSVVPRSIPINTLDGNGHFQQTVYDTSFMRDVNNAPLTCQWKLAINDQCQAAFFSVLLTGITGAGPVNVSAQVNAVAANVSAACVPPPTPPGGTVVVLSINVTPVTVSAASTAFQNLMSSQSPVPAGALNTLGKTIRIKSSGTFNPVNNTEDVALSFKLGTAGFPTLSHFVPGTASVPYNWTMNIDCTTTTIGASGVMSCFGEFLMGGVNGGNALNSNSSPFTSTYTADLTSTVTATNSIAFGTSSATNTATQSYMLVEQLN